MSKINLCVRSCGIVLAIVLFGICTRAQTRDVPKFEVGTEFTSLAKPDSDGGATEPGIGGRFTYNINKSIALEAAGYFFPRRCLFCARENSGNIAEALFGVKAGKRFQKWGIFAKARPGFVSFSQGRFDFLPVTPSAQSLFPFKVSRLTNFAFDAGGVVEFYPSRRIVTRFDAGDTLIHYGRLTTGVVVFGPPDDFEIVPFTSPARTRHNFQFSAGIAFRF